VEDERCPFCQTAIESRALRPALHGRRLARAVVFAGAIGAIGACKKDPLQPAAKDAALKASAPADAAPADAAAEVVVPDHETPALPYGAPPARRRLV